MEHEIVAMWVQTLSGVVGLGCIVWGLFAMRAAGHRRDREIDVLAENMRESTRVVGQALERQGEALAELLRRSA